MLPFLRGPDVPPSPRLTVGRGDALLRPALYGASEIQREYLASLHIEQDWDFFGIELAIIGGSEKQPLSIG